MVCPKYVKVQACSSFSASPLQSFDCRDGPVMEHILGSLEHWWEECRMTKIPYTLGIKSRSSRLPLSENTTYPRASRTNARTGTMGCVSYHILDRHFRLREFHSSCLWRRSHSCWNVGRLTGPRACFEIPQPGYHRVVPHGSVIPQLSQASPSLQPRTQARDEKGGRTTKTIKGGPKVAFDPGKKSNGDN